MKSERSLDVASFEVDAGSSRAKSPGTGGVLSQPAAPGQPEKADDVAAREGESVMPEGGWAPPSKWGVLRHKHYRNVFCASFVSNTGNWMEMVGIQMIVAKETGSLKMLGYFAAAQLLPILLLGIVGGVVADRVNRKKLLVTTQAILMLLAGLVALAAHYSTSLPDITLLGKHGPASGLVSALMVLSILQGIVIAFNMPGWQVLTPRLVPKDELTRAINLNGIQFNAARVVGPGLAGLILWKLGSTPLFVINTVTFLAVVITIATTPDAPAPKRAAIRNRCPNCDYDITGISGKQCPECGVELSAAALAGRRPGTAVEEIREAAGFIFLQRGPLAVFAAMVMMSLLAAPLMRMLPLYVIDVYGMHEADADWATGMLISVLGVGAVLGGLALRYLPAWYPKHHFIPVAIFGAGVSITLFSLTTSLAWGYLAMFVVGAFWIWGFNPAWAAMQHLVSDAMRGRVLAIANVAAFGVTAFGNVAAGWLGESVEAWLATGVVGAWAESHAKSLGTHAAVGLLALMLAGAGVAMMVFRVPEVDGLPRIKGVRRSRLDFVEALIARQHWPANPEGAPEMQGREPV